MEKMEMEYSEGYVCGMIYKKDTGEIIPDAKVTSNNHDLQINMLFKGIFVARGKPNSYRITASAANHTDANLEVRINSDLQERNIYLVPSDNLNQAAQKAN